MSIWGKTCGFLYRAAGWKNGSGPVEGGGKYILLGVPHTCIADFIIAYLYYRQFEKRPHVMVKKEFFRFAPLGWLLKSMNCIPVDRSNGATVIRSVIDAMEAAPGEFALCIAPEGTRKPVHRWKSGYHAIAKAVGCPVYPGYFDWSTKTVGILPEFSLTDDAKADTARLQAMYEELHIGAKHPEKYITR